MDWSAVGSAAWAFVNSPAGLALVASVVVWALAKLYAKKPLAKKYVGTIISAVKYAEKAIPDGTESKGLKRLDTALQYVLRVYAAVEGKQADAAAVAELREAIPVVHEKLEADETL